jgi:hypothetical protein
MSLPNPLACQVCGTQFSKKSNRIKQETFSKSCGGKAADKTENIMQVTPHGEKVTIMLTSEEEVEVTLDPKSDDDNNLVCRYCLHGFHNISNIRAHQCLLEPNISPSKTVLKLLDKSRAKEFREDHRWNTARQVYRTCTSLGIAVPGLFPWFFPGLRVRGQASKHLHPRLQELGCVGHTAYSSLREAAKEGGVLLPEQLTILLPEGGMVSMGPELTVPTSSTYTRGLLVVVE